MKTKIRFGYEKGTGKEANIKLAHTVITGLTHEAGKTTAIMGLIKRSGLKALIIKTKIGEKAISEGAIIPPFYREDFDWEYASDIMEASRKEKLKFERSWIIKYSKGANSLIEFKKNIDDALAGTGTPKIRDLERNVLITLQAYLEKILPELSYAPLSKNLDLRGGINIMDLERFKEETQGLVIRSVLNETLAKDKNTIIIIPEAWKYLPQAYSSPVKRPAEAYIRQGATNGNLLWLDSQDMTGVAKVILKQVSTWILGRQTEINEIKRTLDQIHLNKKSKPTPEDIANLETGEFIVVTSDYVNICYAQPSWLDDATAKKVAMGKMSVEDIKQPTQIAPYQIIAKEQPKEISPLQAPADNKKINELRDDFISNRNDFFSKFEQINDSIQKIQTLIYQLKESEPKIDEDEVVARVLQKMPMQTTVNNTNQSDKYSFDKETIVKEILARVPSGAKVYNVAPLEKIKKDFLEEAKNKILSDIEGLSDKAKKMLKYLETKEGNVGTNEVVTKCFLLKDGGGTRTAVSKLGVELKTAEVMESPNKGKYRGAVKKRISALLENHGATEPEIEQVYNHILMEMLK